MRRVVLFVNLIRVVIMIFSYVLN